MTAPFTPFETFTDNATPEVSADFLNAIQSQGIAPAASVAWTTRPRIRCYSTDTETIELEAVTVLCQDATTSKYGFATIAAQTLDDSFASGGFSTSSWHYVYAVLDNGTPTIEISIGAPDAALLIKVTDPTRRYLFAFYVDSSDDIVPFGRDGFETKWLLRSHSYVFGSEGGVASLSSTNSILMSAQRAPHARFVDIWYRFTAGVNGYVETVGFLGDTDTNNHQIRVVVDINKDITGTQRMWDGGQSYLYATSSDATTAYGMVRVLGWVE